MHRMSVGNVMLLAVCAVAAAVVFGVLWWTHRDVEVEFSAEGCRVLGQMNVPAVEAEGGGCKVEHVNVSVVSLFDAHMYQVEARDGSFAFGIQRGLVTGGVAGRPSRSGG